MICVSGISSILIPLMLTKLSAWFGIYHYVHYVTMERYEFSYGNTSANYFHSLSLLSSFYYRFMAFYFASDYEKDKRVWIVVLLILFNTILSTYVAYLVFYCEFHISYVNERLHNAGIINGIFYVAINFMLSNLSSLVSFFGNLII